MFILSPLHAGESVAQWSMVALVKSNLSFKVKITEKLYAKPTEFCDTCVSIIN